MRKLTLLTMLLLTFAITACGSDRSRNNGGSGATPGARVGADGSVFSAPR